MLTRVPGLPAAEVLWEGRPETGLRRQDVAAGLLAGGLTAGVLGLGLPRLAGGGLDGALAQAWQVAAAFGGVVGGATAVARAAGVGLATGALAAFAAALALAALLTGQRGAALLCPATAAAGLALLAWARWRQHRATRYAVTATEATVGQPERYLIRFPHQAPPVVVVDRFGRGLGDVVFAPAEGSLTTRDGVVFRVPAQARRFVRVADPERLLAALAGAARAPDPAGAEDGAGAAT